MEGILLKEAKSDDSGNLKSQLLIIREYITADQFNDLHQRAFLIQDRHQLISVSHEFWRYMIAVPWGQVFEVFTVACEPVDRREVSCISKSLIKSPEASYKSFGILSDWFREVTALWGNCTDDGDRTFCTIEILHHSGTLIKSGKLGSQVSRETFLCRHFLKSSGKLSKSLSQREVESAMIATS